MRRRKGDTISIDEDAILEFAKQHFEHHKNRSTRWNGRQIRNAFQTATALAEYESIEAAERRQSAADSEPGKDANPVDVSPVKAHLQVSHFEMVADASVLFDDYLAKTIGGTDTERALMDRDRADDFRWTPRNQPNIYTQRPGPGYDGHQDQPHYAPYGREGVPAWPYPSPGLSHTGRHGPQGPPTDWSRRSEYGDAWPAPQQSPYPSRGHHGQAGAPRQPRRSVPDPSEASSSQRRPMSTNPLAEVDDY